MGLRRRYTVMAFAPEHRVVRAIDRPPQPLAKPPIDRADDRAAETIEGAPTLDLKRWFGTAAEADR